MSVKQVLIAHQSTIPHYRVPFYQAVERLRPKWWEFSVIYDAEEARGKSFLEFDHSCIDFPIKHSRSYTAKLSGKQICFQTFPLKASQYDLLIMGSELKNISYPISYLWRFGGKSIAYWGHGKDCSIYDPKGFKSIAEKTKIWLTRRADGFFAYTNSVRDYMASNGVDRRKIFVLQNTIDISRERSFYHQLIGQRDRLRLDAGLNGKKVLLFVGRLTKEKQPDFLFDAFQVLLKSDESYHLMVVGGGDISLLDRFKNGSGKQSFTYLGATDDIGRFCVMSDLYVLPGAIGLGPVHALSYDLTPVVIHSRFHKPEYDYLNSENALILSEGSTAEEYAAAIESLLGDHAQWSKLRLQAWPSIKHLTIENMALNFIAGIGTILQKSDGEFHESALQS